MENFAKMSSGDFYVKEFAGSLNTSLIIHKGTEKSVGIVNCYYNLEREKLCAQVFDENGVFIGEQFFNQKEWSSLGTVTTEVFLKIFLEEMKKI